MQCTDSKTERRSSWVGERLSPNLLWYLLCWLLINSYLPLRVNVSIIGLSNSIYSFISISKLLSFSLLRTQNICKLSSSCCQCPADTSMNNAWVGSAFVDYYKTSTASQHTCRADCFRAVADVVRPLCFPVRYKIKLLIRFFGQQNIRDKKSYILFKQL